VLDGLSLDLNTHKKGQFLHTISYPELHIPFTYLEGTAASSSAPEGLVNF